MITLTQYLLKNLKQLKPDSELPDLIYEVKSNEHKQNNINELYSTSDSEAIEMINNAEKKQINRRILRVIIQQIIRKLIDKSIHLCTCANCDSKKKTRRNQILEKEVTKRVADAYQIIKNQIAERALKQEWAAEWFMTMKSMLNNAAAMNIPYPVPKKSESLRYTSEPKKPKKPKKTNEPKSE